jgi:cobalt-zinc-cadmium efflux system outer membrane protein
MVQRNTSQYIRMNLRIIRLGTHVSVLPGIETARLEGDRAAAREVLNALLARPANAPLAVPMRLRRLPTTELAIASLVERARAGSPSLAASGAEISAAQSRATLAEKAWYPDLTVGAGR